MMEHDNNEQSLAEFIKNNPGIPFLVIIEAHEDLRFFGAPSGWFIDSFVETEEHFYLKSEHSDKYPDDEWKQAVFLKVRPK